MRNLDKSQNKNEQKAPPDAEHKGKIVMDEENL